MLVVDQQPTVGGRRVLTDLVWTASCQPTSSVPFPRRWKIIISRREDYGNEMALVLEGGVCDSKTGIEIPRGKVLVARLKWGI